MADETDLAKAADTAERDALLALLQEHLTIRVSVTNFDGDRSVKVDVFFAGRPVATDWTHI